MGDHDIPVIDIGPLRADPGSAAAAGVTAAIDEACSDSGFFVVTGHGVDDDVASIFGTARAFFGQPQAAKDRSAMIGNDGYLARGTARAGDKEMFDVGLDSFDRWPDLVGFREGVMSYQDAVLGVAADVLAGLARALDIEPTFFAARMRRPQCYLRMIHYPALDPGSRGTATTGAHTDYGAITLLATDGVPGLQVRPRGRDWVPVEAPAGSFVVNLGDLLARWTNARYRSTPHRVVAVSDDARISVPFFVNPDPDTVVECIPSCVDDEHPCAFEPITASEFLQGRIDGTIATGDGTHA